VSAFTLVDGELTAERVPLTTIASQFGTPCFVYSRAALEGAWREFDAALGDLPHLTCYAVKANANLAVLNLFARLGSGFDIVSAGELARCHPGSARPQVLGEGKKPLTALHPSNMTLTDTRSS